MNSIFSLNFFLKVKGIKGNYQKLVKSLKKTKHVKIDQFLDTDIDSSALIAVVNVRSQGRPELPFEFSKPRQQQKMASDLANNHCLEELLMACQISAKQREKPELRKVSWEGNQFLMFCVPEFCPNYFLICTTLKFCPTIAKPLPFNPNPHFAFPSLKTFIICGNGNQLVVFKPFFYE